MLFVSAMMRHRVAQLSTFMQKAVVPVAGITAYLALKKQKRDNAKQEDTEYVGMPVADKFESNAGGR